MEVTGVSPDFNKKTGIIILIDELYGIVVNALWVRNPGIPSLKLTYPLKIDPWKRRFRTWKPSFLGAMHVSLPEGNISTSSLVKLYQREPRIAQCRAPPNEAPTLSLRFCIYKGRIGRFWL